MDITKIEQDKNYDTYVLLSILRLFAVNDAVPVGPFVSVKPDFEKYSEHCSVSALESEYYAELQALLREELGVGNEFDIQVKITELFDVISEAMTYKPSDAVENLVAIYNKRMEMDADDILNGEDMLDLTEFEM